MARFSSLTKGTHYIIVPCALLLKLEFQLTASKHCALVSCNSYISICLNHWNVSVVSRFQEPAASGKRRKLYRSCQTEGQLVLAIEVFWSDSHHLTSDLSLTQLTFCRERNIDKPPLAL